MKAIKLLKNRFEIDQYFLFSFKLDIKPYVFCNVVVAHTGYNNWLWTGDWGSIPGQGKSLTPGFLLKK